MGVFLRGDRGGNGRGKAEDCCNGNGSTHRDSF
jgi:hypothetical protein